MNISSKISSICICILLLLTVIFNFTVNGAATKLDKTDIDKIVSDYMTREGVHGLSLAVAKNRHVVFSKGYGDFGDTVPGDSRPLKSVDKNTLFRIASLSKAITATAILKLNQDGLLGPDGLDTKVFGSGSIFGNKYRGKDSSGNTIDYSNNTKDLTVLHLLEHVSGGWGNYIGTDGKVKKLDPMFYVSGSAKFDNYSYPGYKYKAIDKDNPQTWSHDKLIKFVMGKVSENTTMDGDV